MENEEVHHCTNSHEVHENARRHHANAIKELLLDSRPVDLVDKPGHGVHEAVGVLVASNPIYAGLSIDVNLFIHVNPCILLRLIHLKEDDADIACHAMLL